MERIVKFKAGYDCIKFECCNGKDTCIPGQGGSHGKHGLEIIFVVKGEAGAVQFLLFTGWMPQYSPLSGIGFRDCDFTGPHGPLPADIGFHSKTPRYEGQTPIDNSCEYCDGQPCYYDGSGLSASDAMYALVNGGDAGLWAFLEGFYASTFEGAEYPQPAEFRKPLRAQQMEG